MADSKKEAATKAAQPPSGKAAAKPGSASKSEGAKAKKPAAKRIAAKDAKAVVKKTRRGGVGKRNRKARLARKEEKTAARQATKRSASKSKDGPPEKRKRRPHREIASGVMKFSRPLKFHKRGSWKFAGKKLRKAKPKKPRMIKKEIGGEKNGGFRMVLLKKRRNNYPTADRIKKRRPRGFFKKHKRYMRSSLKPGTICILLAGIHRGKRVVLIKALRTGLLLVNGPFSINGCPLRRVSQNFVIATRTRIDLSGEYIPKHLNDDYFKRIRPKKSKKEGEDIFSTKKEKYVPSEQRKADQKTMDKVCINAIKKFGSKKRDRIMLVKYLRALFGLKRLQNPHSMKF